MPNALVFPFRVGLVHAVALSRTLSLEGSPGGRFQVGNVVRDLWALGNDSLFQGLTSTEEGAR